MIKKLILVLLLFPVLCTAQTITPNWSVFGAGSHSFSIGFTGQTGGRKTLIDSVNLYLRFVQKMDSIANSGYVTHSYFNLYQGIKSKTYIDSLISAETTKYIHNQDTVAQLANGWINGTYQVGSDSQYTLMQNADIFGHLTDNDTFDLTPYGVDLQRSGHHLTQSILSAADGADISFDNGPISFSTKVQTPLIPVDDNDLTNKKYVDNRTDSLRNVDSGLYIHNQVSELEPDNFWINAGLFNTTAFVGNPATYGAGTSRAVQLFPNQIKVGTTTSYAFYEQNELQFNNGSNQFTIDMQSGLTHIGGVNPTQVDSIFRVAKTPVDSLDVLRLKDIGGSVPSGGFARKDSTSQLYDNLFRLTDKAVSRTNLGVYSKTQSDANYIQNLVSTTTPQIAGINMQGNAFLYNPSGQAFIQFKNNSFSGVVDQVGSIGTGAPGGEAVFSHNMDYTTVPGVHLYGNPTVGAIWFAIGNGIHAQYARPNQTQTGVLLYNLTTGSSYTDGTYNTPLTGGSGTGATAHIVVSGGSIVSGSFAIGVGGVNYVIGDVLSASTGVIGTGSGFTVTVTKLGNDINTDKRYLFGSDTASHFSVNYFSTDAVGDGQIQSKRATNKASYAGFTDNVITGASNYSTSGPVYFNPGNIGNIYAATGGGNTQIGGQGSIATLIGNVQFNGSGVLSGANIRGVNNNMTLTATTNNQTLIGHDHSVTFVPGAFTGLTQWEDRFAGNVQINGGLLNLQNATSNLLLYAGAGLAIPAVTTRSLGTKSVWFPAITGSAVDYATGVSSGSLWNSVPTTAGTFTWYGATSLAATLTGAGVLSTVGSVLSGGGFYSATAATFGVNFGAMGGNAVFASTNAPQLLFGGASNVQSRVFVGASSTSALTANTSYGNLIVGSSPITAAATGTHAWIANTVINKIGTITNASSVPITNSASLLIDDVGTGATNNYALVVRVGNTFLGGNLSAVLPAYTSGTSLYTTYNSTNARFETKTNAQLLNDISASLIIGTPTVVAGTGAGTSPTVSVTSNGRGLQLTVTTGTLPTGTNATIATITLANALSYTPYPVFSSASGLTSLLNGASMIFMTSTGTANVTITSGTTALTAATTYVWNIAL